MTTRRQILVGAAAASLIPSRAFAQALPVVAAPSGVFEGVVDNHIWRFRGIRYGTAERFQAPTPFATPGKNREAIDFGPVCPQRGPYKPQSEDCLYLNAWTPGSGAARRPVMVYIHGGAYSNGSVTSPLNDGATLAAAEDVVVVTVNHRLNAFGYLYLARLDARFADSGNLGQLDLILALQWVRDNIASFGGDPGRVFVFGQSGGGAKIATLMGMPAARGLFHSAATMSGQQVTASGPLNATRRAQAYLAKLGVKESDLSPLLAMSTEKLVEQLDVTPDPIIAGGLYFGPVLDMKWLVRHPFWPDANPQSLGIPMILGNTHDETRAFISPDSIKVRWLSWDNLAAAMAPELRMDLLPEWIVSEYRAHFPHDTPEQIFYRATTAGRSWPGQVIEADARAAAGAKSTWVYQVDYQSPTQPNRGALHTMDIALAFGTLGAEGSFTGTGPEARRLSGQVMAAFAALARTGRPVAKGVPLWPAYTLPHRATMLWDVTSRAVNDPRKWERELFARVPYIQPGS
jgi:para-nitrobenzyl esterase